MAELSERELRERAYAHRGEVVAGSGTAIEGRRLEQMVSVRLDPETIVALREIAERRDVSVSELLREAAATVIAADGRAVSRIEISSIRVTRVPPLNDRAQSFETTVLSEVRGGGELFESSGMTSA